jgi:hypothetical protein
MVITKLTTISKNKNGETGSATYKKPRLKIPISMTFCVFSSDIEGTADKGIMTSSKSEVTCTSDLAYHQASRLMQVPLTLGFAQAASGMHTRPATMVCAAPHRMIRTTKISHVRLTLACGGRTRRYMSRRAALTDVMAIW